MWVEILLFSVLLMTRNPCPQDKDNLFLVLDYHPGGDLATQLSRWGRLGRDRARFYTAEISAGLEELHHAGVIYRYVTSC